LKEDQIKENALYHYNSKRSIRSPAIVYTATIDGVMYAIDTYWDAWFSGELGADKTFCEVKNIVDDLEFIMMIEDAKAIAPENYVIYEEKDVISIPYKYKQSGERYFINKNKAPMPNLQQVKDHIDQLLNENMAKIISLQEDIVKLRAWKQELENNSDIFKEYDACYVRDVDYILSRTVK
jgi:hypothetical protein